MGSKLVHVNPTVMPFGCCHSYTLYCNQQKVAAISLVNTYSKGKDNKVSNTRNTVQNILPYLISNELFADSKRTACKVDKLQSANTLEDTEAKPSASLTVHNQSLKLFLHVGIT